MILNVKYVSNFTLSKYVSNYTHDLTVLNTYNVNASLFMNGT